MSFRTQGEFSRIVFAEFRNDSGEEIPAMACIRITGMTTLGGRNVLTVNKPNTYGAQYLHRFSGPLPVAIGAYGVCTWSPECAALYDTADGTPAFGESWGPRSGTWKLKKNTGGFMVCGNADSTNGIVIVQPAPFLRFHGVTDAAISKDASGTVSIYYGTGAGTDSTDFPHISISFSGNFWAGSRQAGSPRRGVNGPWAHRSFSTHGAMGGVTPRALST